jgi:hypothetical protein
MSCTYLFVVEEDARIVAAFAWQPPPMGAAKAVCPEVPAGVLSLSRMVAVPQHERELRHISKPLRVQMRQLIDRTRWPVLVTFSDEGLGHTGHVYKCSGWEKTTRTLRPQFVNSNGARTSTYANGRHSKEGLTSIGRAFIQRWEHWACRRGDAFGFMTYHGWRRVPVAGKVWRSGSQAYRWERN